MFLFSFFDTLFEVFLLAYRNRAMARGCAYPEIVCPSTAHPAFEKAAKLFDMKITKFFPILCFFLRMIFRIRVDNEDRVDVLFMKRSITNDTCMLVASAPNHVTGTIDDIERISEV